MTRTASASASSRRGRMLPVLLVVLVFAALFAAGTLPRLRAAQQREAERGVIAGIPTVFTESVTRDTSATALDLQGTIAGLHETAIYARTNGFVKSVRVDIGSLVRAGDTLIVLDMPDVSQQAQQARATLEQVEATAKLANASLARWKALSEKEVVTKQELDERTAAAAAADAAVRAARANAANLSEVLRFGALVAPFSGIITSRAVDLGSLVSAGAASGNRPLLNLIQIDTLRVTIGVPQSAATTVRIGQTADVSVRELGTSTFAGRVALTSRAFDPATRTLQTEIHIANADRRLMPGMFARVKISVPPTGSGLRIPAIALIIRGDGPQVAVVDSGVVRLVPITLGRDFGTTLEVLDGVRAGEAIIVNPSEQLVTGGKVRAVDRSSRAKG